ISVAQDAKQPSLRPFQVSQLGEMVLGFAECLLRQVFRVGTATAESVGIAVECRVMLIHQPLHRPSVAGHTHNERPHMMHEPGGRSFIPEFARPFYDLLSRLQTAVMALLYPLILRLPQRSGHT